MINELREIEQEIEKLKGRVVRLINLLEKRRVRLSSLTDEDVIGETADRTIPATHIASSWGIFPKKENPESTPAERRQ